jgi:hypothetical protein
MPAFGKNFGGGGRGGFFKRQNFQKSYQNGGGGGGGGGDKPYNSYKNYGNNNYGNNNYGNNNYGSNNYGNNNKSYGNNNYGNNNYNNSYKQNNNWKNKEDGGEGGGYQNNYSGGYGAKWSFAGQKRNAGAPPPMKKADDSSPKPDLVMPQIFQTLSNDGVRKLVVQGQPEVRAQLNQSQEEDLILQCIMVKYMEGVGNKNMKARVMFSDGTWAVMAIMSQEIHERMVSNLFLMIGFQGGKEIK